MGSARYVWELSRAILADADGYVVVLRIFMDESGTHEGSPYIVVGAYADRPKVWAAFTKEWNRAKRPDGIDVYHATDCANQFGEFRGWSKDACNTFSAKMLPLVAKHPRIGVSVGIDMHMFEAEMTKHPHLRGMVGTPYGCCFQWAVQTVMAVVEKYDSNERLAFVHEENDYRPEAFQSFDWVKKHRRKHHSLMTLTFGNKAGYVPLQAADVLAYEGNKRMQGVDAGREPRRSWTALDPDQSRITLLRYGKDNMHLMIERLQLSYDQIQTLGKTF